jgi:nitrite reductase/ring-hydroxylating ferredoxin subunit
MFKKTDMGDWHLAAAFDDVEAGVPHPVEIAGKAIALYRLGDEIHALGDFCPHQRDVRLSEGFLDGEVIECPMHQSCFDVRSGRVLSPPAREDLEVFATRIEDAKVWIEIR